MHIRELSNAHDGAVPLLWRISELLAGMEDAQVVGELNVALVEVEGGAILLSREVQGIQSLSLSLGDGRNVCRSGKTPVSCESAARVLDYEALGCVFSCRLEVQKRPHGMGPATLSKPEAS